MPKSPSPKFWNRIAEKYARDPIADEASYKKKLEITRTYLAPDHRVLEFGCGTGGTALMHAPHVAQIDATDLSPKMIEIAERRAAEASATNVTFATASVEGFTAPDESYDVVLGLSLLHLLDDRQSAIAKIYRLLKPGGVFVSSTACIADMNGLLRYVIPVGTFVGYFPHVAVFTGDRLRADITAQGFEIVHDWRPAKDKALFLIARKLV
jgi:ubiquinone/menaquinone biosynthesis C-methylase UbiE